MVRIFVTLMAAVSFLACDRLPQIGPATENKLASASQDECGFVQNSYGQRVSWKQTLPIKIYIDPTYPPEYEQTVRDAAKRWEDVVGRTLFVFEKATATANAVRDGRNILRWDNPWSGSSGFQAMTSLSWYSNQLTEADLSVNGQNYTYYVDTATSSRDVHLPSLLIHELGHVLGLKHVNGTSVMVTVLDYLLKREIPTEEDKAHIRCEYN